MQKYNYHRNDKQQIAVSFYLSIGLSDIVRQLIGIRRISCLEKMYCIVITDKKLS